MTSVYQRDYGNMDGMDGYDWTVRAHPGTWRWNREYERIRNNPEMCYDEEDETGEDEANG